VVVNHIDLSYLNYILLLMTTVKQLEQKIDNLTACIDSITTSANQSSSLRMSKDRKQILNNRLKQINAGNFYTQEGFDTKLKKIGLIS